MSKNGSLTDLYDEASSSIAAETLMQAVGPNIERRLDVLINQLIQAPPDLAPLLDVRAKIGELWRMRRALREMAAKGRDAIETFNRLLLTKEGEE